MEKSYGVEPSYTIQTDRKVTVSFISSFLFSRASDILSYPFLFDDFSRKIGKYSEDNSTDSLDGYCIIQGVEAFVFNKVTY
jgi:hypothetical protein